MGTKSDFGIATLSGSANVETLCASISITGGSTIKKIVVGNRLGVGTIHTVRLDYAGCETPQKYTFPLIYDSVGTEVQPMTIFSSDEIEVEIPIPSTVNVVYVYLTADTASVKAYAALVWE